MHPQSTIEGRSFSSEKVVNIFSVVCVGEVIEAFFNSILACPFPVEALAAMAEKLGISASTQTVDLLGGEQAHVADSNTGVEHIASESLSGASARGALSRTGPSLNSDVQNDSDSIQVLDLLSICEAELLRAENLSMSSQGEGLVRSNMTTMSSIDIESPRPYEASLSSSVTESFHEAMHAALMKVMAERDEAHAQLIAANVLHIHELEQERRKNQHLSKQLAVAESLARERAQPPVPPQLQQLNQQFNQQMSQLFGKNKDEKGSQPPKEQAQAELQQFERSMKSASEKELVTLCQQLAGEISAKTSLALEIIRIKESREIERKNEHLEKQALKEELNILKKMLNNH